MEESEVTSLFLAASAGNYQAITAASTAIIAIFAGLTAYLTYILSKENRKIRESANHASIVAYLTLDERYSSALNFTIENIGTGPAFDVRFKIDLTEEEVSHWKIKIVKLNNQSPIPIIPQQQKLNSFFAMGFDLFEETPLRSFDVHLSYKDSKGKKTERINSIDVKSLDFIGQLGDSTEKQIAKSLEEIAKSLKLRGKP